MESKELAIDFGRWLLAEADIKVDTDGAWCWDFAGANFNTAEMFEIYLKENGTNIS